MMQRRTPCIGLLIALLLPWGAAAQTTDMYLTIREQELRQAAVKKAEPAVRHFAALVAPSQWPVWVRDINHLLQSNASEVCSAQCQTDEGLGPCGPDDGDPIRPGLSPDVCSALSGDVAQLVTEEEMIRAVGRRLMASAGAQEGIVSERADDPQNIAAHFAAIISIWAPGNDSVETDDGDRMDLRIISADTLLDDGGNAEVESAMAELESALQSLVVRWPSTENDGEPDEDDAISAPTSINERLTAAVWRYQFGLRLLRDERAPLFPAPEPYADDNDDGERQYMFRNWPAVENALERIWNVLPQNPDAYSPALTPDEIAIITFGDTPIPSLPNIEVWARMDGNVADDHPFADIGLRWVSPQEPMLPSLLSDEYLSCIGSCDGDSLCAATCAETGIPMILGGTYPPEPVDDAGEPMDGRGLCSQPFAAEGYLCRPLESGSRSPCLEEVDTVNGTIILTRCTEACANGDDSGEDCEETYAGPDVCAFTWDNEERDTAHQCSIELTCDACDYGEFIPAKDGERITVCPDPNLSAPATYGILYGLAKAGQSCDRAPGEPVVPDDATDDERRAACCSLENEAYRLACQSMEADGVFADLPDVDGIPLDANTCAEMMSDYVCNDVKGFGECPGSWQYTPAAFALLQASFARNPADVPSGCAEAIDEDTRDDAIDIVTDALNAGMNVCSPGRETTYRNSIGNNLCYVGQCIEQGMETHRVVGGRMPLTAGDGIAPFLPDAAEDIPGGLRFAPPSASQGILPDYLPEVLLDAMETRLCQTNGLPPLLPQTRCGFDARRALYGANGLEGVTTASASQPEELLRGFAVQAMAEAFGTRLGSDFTAQYLAGAAAPLTGVVRSAAEMLTQLNETEFPSEMCPLGP